MEQTSLVGSEAEPRANRNSCLSSEGLAIWWQAVCELDSAASRGDAHALAQLSNLIQDLGSLQLRCLKKLSPLQTQTTVLKLAMPLKAWDEVFSWLTLNDSSAFVRTCTTWQTLSKEEGRLMLPTLHIDEIMKLSPGTAPRLSAAVNVGVIRRITIKCQQRTVIHAGHSYGILDPATIFFQEFIMEALAHAHPFGQLRRVHLHGHFSALSLILEGAPCLLSVEADSICFDMHQTLPLHTKLEAIGCMHSSSRNIPTAGPHARSELECLLEACPKVWSLEVGAGSLEGFLGLPRMPVLGFDVPCSLSSTGQLRRLPISETMWNSAFSPWIPEKEIVTCLHHMQIIMHLGGMYDRWGPDAQFGELLPALRALRSCARPSQIEIHTSIPCSQGQLAETQRRLLAEWRDALYPTRVELGWPSRIGQLRRAMSDYQSEGAGYISVSKGDFVHVLSEDFAGEAPKQHLAYLYGSLVDGREGWLLSSTLPFTRRDLLTLTGKDAGRSVMQVCWRRMCQLRLHDLSRHLLSMHHRLSTHHLLSTCHLLLPLLRHLRMSKSNSGERERERGLCARP